jgi:hypothetical protein
MTAIGLLTALAAITPLAAAAKTPAGATAAPAHSTLLQTPEAIHDEHLEIHATLQRAIREPGRLGAAARELSAVLDPHFRREEEIATPPLGLLVPLSKGPVTSDMRAVLPMTDALERELPQMLQDHGRIGAARERFEAEALRAGKPDYVRLSETLAHHARQEEEVLYPAAILVGRFVRGAKR